MARIASSWLIPPLNGLRLNWLAHAELSGAPDRPDSCGLSLYQFDRFEYQVFARKLPAQLVTLDERMRDRFDLDPRHWTKLHFAREAIVGYSQYFTIDPSLYQPIATLRVGLRQIGGAETPVGGIEPGFGPALERADTLFALIAKWDGDRARARISCRVDSTIASDLLASLERCGFLEDGQRRGYEALRARFQATCPIFVSVDPASAGSTVVDFEDVPDDRVPEACQDLWGNPPPEAGHRYLKARIRPGGACEWTVYRPLPALLGAEDWDRLTALDPLSTDEVGEYYDEQSPAIMSAMGNTYQAGLLDSGVEKTLEQLVHAAEVQPGERVLDLGCGAGGPAVAIVSRVGGTRVTGLTISSAQAEAAKSLASVVGLSDRLVFEVGDYHRQPYLDGGFDRIVAFEALGYATDLEIVLREALRVLRPGGSIYIKDVVRKPDPLARRERLELLEFDRIYHQRTPTPEAIARALHFAGFVDLRVEGLSPTFGAGPFYRAMVDPRAPNHLNAFGESHWRAFQCLPVAFAHFSARKPDQ